MLLEGHPIVVRKLRVSKGRFGGKRLVVNRKSSLVFQSGRCCGRYRLFIINKLTEGFAKTAGLEDRSFHHPSSYVVDYQQLQNKQSALVLRMRTVCVIEPAFST